MPSSVGRLCAPLFLFQLAASAQDHAPTGLLPPVRLEAGGAPIDVTVGHAAPVVIDFDGDGLRDLLVGEFGEGTFPPERLPEDVGGLARDSFSLGKLRVYRNVGSAEVPRFEDFEYLRAGKEDASIPTT
ncbi:MAG: hypothetical protein CMJ84_16930 [Planctomycetes bacterium]|jgi:hypothetical protein|nr:hypothetical protein [Planctomycetota bacterium]MDP6408813.1 hypothetical protein [Planctomycetota bacterium]